MTKILIVGSGGREHAIAWAIRNTSTEPVEILCAPGNAGIGQIAQLVDIPINDHSALADFVRAEKIDLTFVGPEAPLASGIVDLFATRNLRIVGPNASAARLEASKIFAKDFMARYRIPTAAYRVGESPAQTLQYLRSGEFGSAEAPVVIKADGLAAGKGVVVAENRSEAEKAIEDLMVHHLAGKDAAARVVIEEALIGTEASLLLFTDGRDYAVMPAARDHKRIGENDTGPNTGGMGTITDGSVLQGGIQERVVREIVEPTLAGALAEGFAFKGILFLGLMLTEDGPKLLEYNVRFGDPETQAILVRLKTDCFRCSSLFTTRRLVVCRLTGLKVLRRVWSRPTKVIPENTKEARLSRAWRKLSEILFRSFTLVPRGIQTGDLQRLGVEFWGLRQRPLISRRHWVFVMSPSKTFIGPACSIDVISDERWRGDDIFSYNIGAIPGALRQCCCGEPSLTVGLMPPVASLVAGSSPPSDRAHHMKIDETEKGYCLMYRVSSRALARP